MQKYLSVFTILCLMACAKPETHEVAKPANLLSASKMTGILTEMHLANAYMAAQPIAQDTMHRMELAYYKAIYKKYGVSEEDFKASFTYYKYVPVEMDSIYAYVIENLAKMETKLKK
jgi:hypothetical protein